MSSDEGRSRAVRQCVNSACRLRYVAVGPTTKSTCEECGSTTQLMGETTTGAAAPAGPPPEPWYYPGARIVAFFAIAAAIVSVITGFIVGIEASRYQTDTGGTGHHFGRVILGLLTGAMGALLWVGVAAALLLLVEIGESLRRDAS
jgi:hypothetical protein